MRKLSSKILCILLCVAFLFAGCASAPPAEPTTNNEPTTETTTEVPTQTYAESVEAGDEIEVTVSDEVVELVEDTNEIVENGEDIATDETIPADEADEKSVADEGTLEPDASVDQENISYDGTNTGKGSALLSGAPGLIYYSQADSRWGSVLYTSHNDRSQTIKSSGCGPTSAAMVISASKGIITPPTVARLFVDNGYRTRNNGTAWAAWSFVADYFDFDFYKSTSSYSTMISYLKTDKNKDGVSDYFVVASCGYGLFTTGGHYIALMGDEGGKIKVYDPYLYYGKFTTSSRKNAGVKVSGTTAYVSESSFQKYANTKNFWIYSNDSGTAAKKEETTTKKDYSKAESTTKSMYVTASALNVRKGPGTNYSILDCLKNDTKVTVYETKSGWSRIGTGKWVSSKYLSTKKPTTSSSSSVTVAYVYVPATGRYAYCKYSAIEKYNGYYRLKNYTTLYSKSNLTGTKYNYLAKTKVVIKKTL
ncbi:MAG: SH3 domain-containing protein [Eubacterium sp.]|nr:SH3 domain-containing protein [Eubacterium sp.]